MTATPDGHGPSPRIEELTRVVLRPMATPLPLGFLALAIGSCLLTALQLGWIPVSTTHQVASALLVLVAPLEFLTTVIAFLIRDVVMATALGLLTGGWSATGVLLLTGPPGSTSPVVGIVAVALAVAMLVPALSAWGSKPAAAVITAVASGRFALTGVYELGAGPAWKTAGGIVGVVLLATALYGSLALALEDARHHAVLPVSRRGLGRYAFSGDLGHQLTGLPTEAGVRQES